MVLSISSTVDMELSRTNTAKKNETVAERRRRQHNRLSFDSFGYAKVESLMRRSYLGGLYDGFEDKRTGSS